MTDMLPAIQPLTRTRRQTVALWGIGTAAPQAFAQREAMVLAADFSCDTPGQRAWLERVFLRAGVEQRGSVLLGERGLADAQAFYGTRDVAGAHGPTTAARMQRYAQEAPPLAAKAALAALADAQVQSAAITHLITVSCTGFFAPGLDVELIERLGLARGVQRLHIGFMGCHAGFNALAAARDIVQGRPDAVVLVCCVELCTLHFAYGWKPEQLVANALFADGASACVVGAEGVDMAPATAASSDAARWRLLDAASILLPDSREAMTWLIGDHGFQMTLSSALPGLIKSHLRPWCEAWLDRSSLTLSDIRHWAIHPGGPRILAAAAESLDLPDAATAVSRAVLARQGNMSSATLLFLLQQLAGEQTAGPCVAIGFGPGLMAEGLLLEIN